MWNLFDIGDIYIKSLNRVELKFEYVEQYQQSFNKECDLHEHVRRPPHDAAYSRTLLARWAGALSSW